MKRLIQQNLLNLSMNSKDLWHFGYDSLPSSPPTLLSLTKASYKVGVDWTQSSFSLQLPLESIMVSYWEEQIPPFLSPPLPSSICITCRSSSSKNSQEFLGSCLPHSPNSIQKLQPWQAENTGLYGSNSSSLTEHSLMLAENKLRRPDVTVFPNAVLKITVSLQKKWARAPVPSSRALGDRSSEGLLKAPDFTWDRV